MEPSDRPSPRNSHVFKIIATAGGTLFLIGVLFFLVEGLLSPFNQFTLKGHLIDEWLGQCPAGDVRFTCTSHDYYHLMGYVDFGKNILGVGGDDYRQGGVTVTLAPGSMMGAPITPEQKPELQKIIAALPSRPMFPLGGYNFEANIYFACWRGGVLCYFQYPKSHLPEPVIDLFKFFAPQSVEALEK